MLLGLISETGGCSQSPARHGRRAPSGCWAACSHELTTSAITVDDPTALAVPSSFTAPTHSLAMNTDSSIVCPPSWTARLSKLGGPAAHESRQHARRPHLDALVEIPQTTQALTTRFAQPTVLGPWPTCELQHRSTRLPLSPAILCLSLTGPTAAGSQFQTATCCNSHSLPTSPLR